MRKMNRLLLTAMVSLMAVKAYAAPERAQDFTLTDHESKSHQLSKYAYQNAVVIISQANNCAMNEENIANYKLTRTNWEYEGISFLMLNSSNNDDLESIRANEEVWRFDHPILLDSTQLVANSLGIENAGEIVVIDPQRMNIVYRGPLDRSGRNGTSGMRDAMRALADGTDSRDMETTVVEVEPGEGCALDFPIRDRYADSAPDYETEVAPILIERCVGCHIQGGIGPFAMNSHQMVQGWSPMIREVVMTRRMPPMQVDPNVRHWYNAGNMPDEETQILIHWINAGSPR